MSPGLLKAPQRQIQICCCNNSGSGPISPLSGSVSPIRGPENVKRYRGKLISELEPVGAQQWSSESPSSVVNPAQSKTTSMTPTASLSDVTKAFPKENKNWRKWDALDAARERTHPTCSSFSTFRASSENISTSIVTAGGCHYDMPPSSMVKTSIELSLPKMDSGTATADVLPGLNSNPAPKNAAQQDMHLSLAAVSVEKTTSMLVSSIVGLQEVDQLDLSEADTPAPSSPTSSNTLDWTPMSSPSSIPATPTPVLEASIQPSANAGFSSDRKSIEIDLKQALASGPCKPWASDETARAPVTAPFSTAMPSFNRKDQHFTPRQSSQTRSIPLHKIVGIELFPMHVSH